MTPIFLFALIQILKKNIRLKEINHESATEQSEEKDDHSLKTLLYPREKMENQCGMHIAHLYLIRLFSIQIIE